MADYKTSRVEGLLTVSGTVDLSRLEVKAYSESLLVAASTLTTVLSFTSSLTKNTNIASIVCSGDATAKWQFFINTVLKGTIRSGGGNRNARWNFSFPLALDASSIIDIKVTHFHTGETLDFEAGLYAFESVP